MLAAVFCGCYTLSDMAKTLLKLAILFPLLAVAAQDNGVIAFGTKLVPKTQIAQSQQFAKSLAKPGSPGWQAKGDQRRTYRFPGTETDLPYRVYVPTTWDGKAKLPLVLMLHGGGSNESQYLDQNNKQLLKLAEDHGYLLVSPLGMESSGRVRHLPASSRRIRPGGNSRAAADHGMRAERPDSRTQRAGRDQRPGDGAQRVSRRPRFDVPCGPFDGQRRHLVSRERSTPSIGRRLLPCPVRLWKSPRIRGIAFGRCRCS